MISSLPSRPAATQAARRQAFTGRRPVRLDWQTGHTGSASRARLGSGETVPTVFRDSLAPRDVLLLASDGAWTTLGTAALERAVRSMVMRPFADLPSAVLDEASRRGRADDMTVVALRLLRA